MIHEQILSMPNYRPNESDLTSERVGEWIAYLRRTRNARLEARASTENTRQERDDFLLGTNGLGVRMRMVKMYINSILDPNDDRSRRIRGLRFVFRAK